MFVIGPNATYRGTIIIGHVGANDFNDPIERLVMFRIMEEIGIDCLLEILFVGV